MTPLAFAGPDLSRVHVLCTVETRDRAHIGEVQHRLAESGVELFGKVPSLVVGSGI